MDIREKLRANPKAFILLALWAVSLIFVFGNEFTAYVNRDAAWLVLALLTCLAAFLVCNRFGDSKSKPEEAEIGKPEDEKVDYSLKAQLEEALSSPMSLMAYGGKKEIPQELYDKLVCCAAAKDLPNNSSDDGKDVVSESRFPGENWSMFYITELVWGVLIGDRVVYNLDDYSLFGAARLAVYFPSAVLYTNMAIYYMGDGNRGFEKINPYYLYNSDVSYKDWYVADGRKVNDMFPDYAEYLKNNSRWKCERRNFENLHFFVSSDFRRVCNAFQSGGSHQDSASFRALANGSYSVLNVWSRVFYIRPLQSVFASVVSAYRSGALSRTAEAAAKAPFFFIERDSVRKDYTQFYVGYPNCSYSRAKEVAADVDEISRAYLKEKRHLSFNILQNGIYLNSEKVNGRQDGTMMFPLNIYEAWSRPFTDDELADLFGSVTLSCDCDYFDALENRQFALKMQKGFCER